jgi:hypothetical protein
MLGTIFVLGAIAVGYGYYKVKSQEKETVAKDHSELYR